MIKIEKINATQPTVVRGGLRQVLLVNSHVTAEELASIEAETGTILYSVDELEVKELTFQPKPVVTAAVVKQPAPRTTKPATKTAELSVEPAGTVAQ
jgi:hypothetical protein